MERLRRVEAQLRGSGRSGRPLRASAPPVATAGDPGYASPQWQEYVAAGLLRAAALNNRFPAADAAAPGTIEGYRKHGFCVLTGCVSRAEVSTIKRDFDALLATAPATNRGTTDRRGRPSPFGGYMGIDAKGRVGIINHPLLMSQSALCCYGHPRILAVVQAINGADFVPMNEGMFHKAAGDGVPTGWHQDGRTHWTEDGAPLAAGRTGAEGALTHGLNLSVCITAATPENCLWVVPGSQQQWMLARWPARRRGTDGEALTEGSFPQIREWLPAAVPVVMQPGDVMVVDRSSLHGSFPNRSPNRRVTLIMSFHSRHSVEHTTAHNVHAFKNGEGSKLITYVPEDIDLRARMIPLAIDARRQRYPDEFSFEYKGQYNGDAHWSEKTEAEIRAEGDEYWRRNMTL